MKLNEFNMKPTQVAKKALKEHFNTNLNVDSLSLYDTKRMLTKVRGLISEMRTGQKAVTRESDSSYMKAVFMEQALTHRYGELKALPMYNQRIVLENEEVEKSQVVLAAQEMVDSLQKMVEEVSDMLVKELPAVVDGVNSEFGTNEGETYNQQVSEALSSLQAALTQAQGSVKSALGSVTGQGGDMGAGMDDGMGMDDDMSMDDGDMEMDSDVSVEEPEMDAEPEEEPEEGPTGNVGRATR